MNMKIDLPLTRNSSKFLRGKPKEKELQRIKEVPVNSDLTPETYTLD